MRRLEWFFDFVSPFSYLAFIRLAEFPEGVDIVCRPVLFAGLLNHWNQKGPAEIPPKRAWTNRWCTWSAERLGVRFCFPAVHPFNPLPHLRLAIAAGNTPHAIEQIFETIWTTGADPSDAAAFDALRSSLGVEQSKLSSPEIKNALRSATEQAVSYGIFGVPTLRIDGELFWGVDATDFARAYLADPALLHSEKMHRLISLPFGAARKAAG